ncbi:MAG: 50S ribosomal protein L29 [Kiritimatiellae bacterium]|nr:50S ribosomal protein L29 [Kiritimatiellia bacterium]
MKARAIREWTDDELRVQIEQARRELFNLRMQPAVGRLERPSRIREVRRDLARMETVRTERRKAKT